MNFPPLTALLPHRAPMLFLRGIISHDPAETVCASHFDAEAATLFGTGGELPAALALELVAQTMAVHDGLRRRAEHRPAAARGFLLGSRRFDLLVRSLPVGEDLRVLATGEKPATGGLVRFAGRVEDCRGGLLACGEVTVLEDRMDPLE